MRGWPKDHPYIYLIEKGESKLLYAHDTGYLYEEVWDYLTDLAGRIDGRLTAVSLDCTHGNDVIGDNGGHMGLPDAIRVKDRLLQIGLCDENTRFIVNHFSHNSGPLPTELAEIAAGHDIQVSYDGMTLDI